MLVDEENNLFFKDSKASKRDRQSSGMPTDSGAKRRQILGSGQSVGRAPAQSVSERNSVGEGKSEDIG